MALHRCFLPDRGDRADDQRLDTLLRSDEGSLRQEVGCELRLHLLHHRYSNAIGGAQDSSFKYQETSGAAGGFDHFQRDLFGSAGEGRLRFYCYVWSYLFWFHCIYALSFGPGGEQRVRGQFQAWADSQHDDGHRIFFWLPHRSHRYAYEIRHPTPVLRSAGHRRLPADQLLGHLQSNSGVEH